MGTGRVGREGAAGHGYGGRVSAGEALARARAPSTA
jgi:hypothetical protein